MIGPPDDIRRRAGWWAAWVAGLVLVGAGCESEGGSDRATDTASTAVEQSADTGHEGDIEIRRDAYGLPLPPKIANMRRYESSVQVQTQMTIDELVDFFDARLTDYEILRPRDWKLRIVGLHEHMPSIKAHKYGPLVDLTYLQNRERPEPKGVPEPDAGPGDEPDEPRGAGTSNESRDFDRGAGNKTPHWSREWSESGGRKDGKPVGLRTPEGDLLAPGAKWGEPYTPPPDSPLHKERYRENFGEPFGEWTLP